MKKMSRIYTSRGADSHPVRGAMLLVGMAQPMFATMTLPIVTLVTITKILLKGLCDRID